MLKRENLSGQEATNSTTIMNFISAETNGFLEILFYLPEKKSGNEICLSHLGRNRPPS